MEQKNTLMGVLCYLGFLVLVPLFTTKDDPFVAFHIKQGLVLFVIEIGVWVLGMFVWYFGPVYSLLNLATLILAIIGIINVSKGEKKELPLVGQFAEYFKI